MNVGNYAEGSSYRESHASEGYGEHYEETYQRGYYAYQWRYIEKALLERIFARLTAGKKLDYLDFACGTGRILAVAAPYFVKATGVDISPQMLKVAKRRCPNVRLIEADITREPLTEQFDIISAFRFFLNAEPALADQVLARLVASLKPGSGRLVTNIHMNRVSPTGIVYRIRNRIKGKEIAHTKGFAEFQAVLGRHGLQIEDTCWYSYLPRTGWRFDWLPRYFMKPTEAVFGTLRIFKRNAQSFIVICKRVDEN